MCGVRVSVSALGFCDKWEEIGRSGYEGRGGGEQSGPKEVEGANLLGSGRLGLLMLFVAVWRPCWWVGAVFSVRCLGG